MRMLVPMSIPKSNHKLKQLVDDATPEERRFLEQYLIQVQQVEKDDAAPGLGGHACDQNMIPPAFWPDLKYPDSELLDDGL